MKLALLAPIALSLADKPVFDGTFGANCPPCKEFGQTVLKKLYAAEGIADAVDFQMHSAIRSAGDPATDHAWACPDEDPGCPMTKWFICAVDGWNATTTTQDQQVGFLTCWDDATGTSEAKATACAKTTGLDMAKISTCAAGAQGERLQLSAAKYFEQRFPTHAHSGMFQVPHVFINGKDIGEERDYDAILKTLCDTGITAGACSSVANSTHAPPPAAVAQVMETVAMSGAAATHYGDPLAGPCMSDEQNITITGVAGSVCSPAATGVLKQKCPTDTPAGCTIAPAAILQDQSGDKYCALECSPSLPIKDQKLADSICGVDNMSCKPISGVGICTYDA